MPIQLNIYLGKDIVDAQINRLEELQQFFRNQHVVDTEKIAKIQGESREAKSLQPKTDSPSGGLRRHRPAEIMKNMIF